MPSSLRANPDTGMAEYYHPDSQLYVQAFAMMQIVGGMEVGLTATQLALLNTIANATPKFGEIVTELKDLESDIESFSQLFSQFVEEDFTSLVEAINENGSDSTTLTAIKTALESLKLTIEGYADNFALISDYSTGISGVAGKIDSVKGVTDKLVTLLTPPSNMECLTIDIALTTQEYPYAIPAGTKRIAFECRGDRNLNDVVADIRYSMLKDQAFPVGSNNKYAVLSASFVEEFDLFLEQSTMIYFASSVAGVKLSIRRWF